MNTEELVEILATWTDYRDTKTAIAEFFSDLVGKPYKKDIEGAYYIQLGEYRSSDSGTSRNLTIRQDSGYTTYVNHSWTQSVKKERAAVWQLMIKNRYNNPTFIPLSGKSAEELDDICTAVIAIDSLSLDDAEFEGLKSWDLGKAVDSEIADILKHIGVSYRA